MKTLFLIFTLGFAANSAAETFILKDGARLEGEVTGEMDNTLLVQTKYGSLTINKADVQERVPAQPAPALPPQASTAAVAVSTAASQPAPEPPQVKLTFATVLPSTSSRLLVYSENDVAIATETFSADGALLSLEGAIKDGTYTEYYDQGALKTVKTVRANKTDGTLKTYYPSSAVQVEAYYLGGQREGLFKYFAEDGKPLMEATYRNDRLNGWKKEFDAAGALKSEAYYEDDKPAEAPKAVAPAQPAAETESMVTAKPMKLARGERFSFQLNGKYIGKATLDKDFNIISRDGKIPDGVVKVYSAEGKLQKEFVFEKSAIKTLRVYEDGGPLKGEYSFKDDKAVKK
jgi:antitoxin component YwqK of YwqJK toxin-antitoxin module